MSCMQQTTHPAYYKGQNLNLIYKTANIYYKTFDL